MLNLHIKQNTHTHKLQTESKYASAEDKQNTVSMLQSKTWKSFIAQAQTQRPAAFSLYDGHPMRRTQPVGFGGRMNQLTPNAMHNGIIFNQREKKSEKILKKQRQKQKK